MLYLILFLLELQWSGKFFFDIWSNKHYSGLIKLSLVMIFYLYKQRKQTVSPDDLSTKTSPRSQTAKKWGPAKHANRNDFYDLIRYAGTSLYLKSFFYFLTFETRIIFIFIAVWDFLIKVFDKTWNVIDITIKHFMKSYKYEGIAASRAFWICVLITRMWENEFSHHQKM